MTGYRIQDARCRIQDTRCRMQDKARGRIKFHLAYLRDTFSGNPFPGSALGAQYPAFSHRGMQ
jgi:hypothetical protein